MYQIRKYENEKSWDSAEVLRIGWFHEKSSEHHPETTCLLLYDAENLYLRFHVRDQFVRCAAQRFLDPVCRDSCVEFFAEPAGSEAGYLNFEFSGNGTMLLSHIIDPTRIPGGFKDYYKLGPEADQMIKRKTTLPKTVDPEIADPVEWELSVVIPFALFAKTHHIQPPVSGTSWRANFYKCADGTSHPHWAAWQPVSQLNFHMPQHFGKIGFA